MFTILRGESFEAEDIARRLITGGHEVQLDCRDDLLLERLGRIGKVSRVETSKALDQTEDPKVVWSADLTGRQLHALAEALPAGTILVNSRKQYYEDNIKLEELLVANGGRYVDVGAVVKDYRLALFVGGDTQAFQDVEPLLGTLAGDGSYYHCGPSGTGHFLLCMQQKYEVQVHSALASIVSEIRRSPFKDDINLESFLLFSHLFCKKQPLPDSVWQFLQVQAHAAVARP